MTSQILRFSVCTLLLFGHGLTLAATRSALAFEGGTAVGVAGGITVGWEFDVATPVLVAELGVHDSSPLTPLEQSHQVGLWAPNGTLLRETIVPVNAPIRDGFRYVPIEPVLIPAASGYVIGGLFNTDVGPADFPIHSALQSTIEQVSFVRALQNSGAGVFSRPTTDLSGLNDGVFGPGFTSISWSPRIFGSGFESD